MGMVIRETDLDERIVREELIKAEDTLLAKTGRRFFFRRDRADEDGLAFSVARDDGAEAEFDVPHPRLQGSQTWDARTWLRGEMDKIVERLALGIAEDEAAAPEPERFEAVIVFTSRPDIVLTPPGGVPADEATRVYRHFRDGAAAIGGRCFTAPVEA